MRYRTLLLIALLALLLGGHALALVGEEDGFTGTVPLPGFIAQPSAIAPRRAAKAASTAQVNGKAVDPLNIVGLNVTGKLFTADTVFTANVTGGSGSYEYEFYLVTKFDASAVLDLDNINWHGYWKRSTSNRFAYRLVVPGDYYILVYVYDTEAKDAAGKALSASNTYTFPVAADSEDRVTVAQKVEQVTGECLAALGEGASDYDKALWLHDWLTHHAHYSTDTYYYSEDGVLIRGDGVCDSYCKAYRLLLNAVGIECDRVLSIDGKHAWNRAKLEGEWFQIDVTWDDPSGGVEPVSGQEKHVYFGLTDDLMTKNHEYTVPQDKECLSLAQNYYIRSGVAELWAADVRNGIRQIVRSGEATRSFPIGEGGYEDEEGRTLSQAYIAYGVVMWHLDQADSLLVDAPRGVVQVEYTLDQDEVGNPPWVHLGSVASTVDALCLPAALLTLGTEAFAGNASRIIAIPEGVTEIPSQAFANCPNLERVFIPETVTSIASDAFVNSGTPAITCRKGNAAHDFAIDKQLPFTLY